jgi:hypothetical protein
VTVLEDGKRTEKWLTALAYFSYCEQINNQSRCDLPYIADRRMTLNYIGLLQLLRRRVDGVQWHSVSYSRLQVAACGRSRTVSWGPVDLRIRYRRTLQAMQHTTAHIQIRALLTDVEVQRKFGSRSATTPGGTHLQLHKPVLPSRATKRHKERHGNKSRKLQGQRCWEF